MKKLVLVALVAVAVLAFCAPALAWPVSLPWWEPSHHFTCVGKIQAVDTAASTVTVRVHLGRRVARRLPRRGPHRRRGGRRRPRVQGRRRAAHTHRPRRPGRRREAPPSRAYRLRVGVGLPCRQAARHAPSAAERRIRALRLPRARDCGRRRAARTLTARMNRVTRALSPCHQRTCDFAVAADARIWVLKDGWPVQATLADVVVGDRVYAQGGADRSIPSAPVFTHPLDGRAARPRRRLSRPDPGRMPSIRGRAARRRPAPLYCSSIARRKASTKSSFSTSSTWATRRVASGNNCSTRPASVLLLTTARAASPPASDAPSSSASFVGRLPSGVPGQRPAARADEPEGDGDERRQHAEERPDAEPGQDVMPAALLALHAQGAVLAACDERGIIGGHQSPVVQRDDVVEVALRRLSGLVQAYEQVHRVVRHGIPPSVGRHHPTPARRREPRQDRKLVSGRVTRPPRSDSVPPCPSSSRSCRRG